MLLLVSWVARDINGTALENAPFEAVFHHQESAWRFQRHLPVQVQSCWNGIAVLDPAPFYAHPHVKFRMANLSAGECSASECSLICNDYWQAGYGRIIMISRVKLAYDNVSRPRVVLPEDPFDQHLTTTALDDADCLGDYPPREEELDVYSRVHAVGRKSGRPSFGSSRSQLVRTSRSLVQTRRERGDRVPSTSAIW